jgi:hypothetical protein
MEIKTEFIDEYTPKIDKLLNHCNNQKIIIYGLIAPLYPFNFWVWLFILSKIKRFFLSSS